MIKMRKSKSHSDGSKTRLFNIRGIGSVKFYNSRAYASYQDSLAHLNRDIRSWKNANAFKGDLKWNNNKTVVSGFLNNDFPIILKIVKEGTLYRYYRNNSVENMNHYERFLLGKEETKLPIVDSL